MDNIRNWKGHVPFSYNSLNFKLKGLNFKDFDKWHWRYRDENNLDGDDDDDNLDDDDEIDRDHFLPRMDHRLCRPLPIFIC